MKRKEERNATAQVVVCTGRLQHLFVCHLNSLYWGPSGRFSGDMDPSTTILRVKRKRGTDPADALLLACKRIRPEAAAAQPSDETEPEPQEPNIENSVFKLVATVASQVMNKLYFLFRLQQSKKCCDAKCRVVFSDG